ncbi:MAG: HAMP domain-containing histidine kinase [Azoarcus sp.]|nr:HAMP domain-containing histidine kinase [Azoarcus sp.]
MRSSRQPFARRIVVAFTLMTFIVSGVLSLCLVYAVHLVETELVSRSLDKTLDRILGEDLRQGKAPRLDSDMRFFASDRPEYAIPDAFAQAGEGFNEIVGDDAYWVFVREANGQRYLLVQDQHEFEAHEVAMFGILFAGFLLTVAGAWALGKLTAKKVMAPVSRLAQQVRQRDPLRIPVSPLAQDYADDEIGRLAAAFDDALQRLGLAMERERLFTSDVSHELRTPLMVVATSCELLASASLGRREREQLDRIARAAAEMQSLVDTFLMLARARPDETGPLQGQPEGQREGDADLASVAEEQYARWLPALHAKGLAFEITEESVEEEGGEGAGTHNPARYNAAFLRAVMGNLLRNALHYTERGGIHLVLEADGFRVEDSGVGIPAAEKEQIFRPFTRGGQARGEGLGLGLSLVKRICMNQGWEITLDDLPEGGACFRVKLR